ncbi:MAG: LytR/AlgR family response regulator transcription factor [Pseudomonadales bacterium]
MRVWHIWIASLGGFILGYYFLPISDLLIWLLGVDTGDHAGPLRFSQLLPVWSLVTYLFIDPYLSQGLRSELARLKDVNEVLKTREPSTKQSDHEIIRFESGRTQFALSAKSIRNIVVEDHYCYVHYQHNAGWVKRDLAMPLRDVQTLLPPIFVQVHRSHIINLEHVVSIRRIKRGLRVILNDGYEVPVSRHRLDEVLPLLRSF